MFLKLPVQTHKISNSSYNYYYQGYGRCENSRHEIVVSENIYTLKISMNCLDREPNLFKQVMYYIKFQLNSFKLIYYELAVLKLQRTIT